MQRRTISSVVAYVVLVTCFSALLLGGLRTFRVRLETGDSFPEYSTYRADPKGLKALYESLQSTNLVEAARRLQSSKILPSGENQALVAAGVRADQSNVSQDDSRFFDHWLSTGGRLVIALRPEQIERPARSDGETPRSDIVDDTSAISWRNLMRRWGVEIVPLGGMKTASVSSQLFGEIPRWLGASCFDRLTPEWRVIATQGDKPVIVERPFAGGSLVLLSDSYPFSNEALAADRNTGFLLWSIGSRARVVFEETHLGLSERPGIMTLARRYGLQGTLVSIVAVLLLFIWKSQYTLVPRGKIDQDTLTVAGYSSEQAFLNLLQRTIPQRDLLGVCIEAWLKATRPTPTQLAGLERFRSESDKGTTVVRRYNQLTSLLNEKL